MKRAEVRGSAGEVRDGRAKRWIWSSALALLLAAAGGAAAQEAAAADPTPRDAGPAQPLAPRPDASKPDPSEPDSLAPAAQDPTPDEQAAPPSRGVEEITVTGRHVEAPVLGPAPRTYVSASEASHINVSTVEDVLSYAPSVIVRRRFIGDTNGTLGMRGSNMFQTTRSMVFADGLPLHYMLQTQYSGAPRWGLVSKDEIAGVEVLYGPFSAEYGGGSMGGVINIQTEMPQGRQIHLEGSGMLQDYDFLGTNDRYPGRQLQASYGDRIGNLSFYVSGSHLNNQGQPMTFFSATPAASPPAGSTPTPVSGAIEARSASGPAQLYFGDTGPEDATSNLAKIKLGYRWGEWLGRFTAGYENRQRRLDDPQDYLRDSSGAPVFSGTATQGAQSFTVTPSSFTLERQDRRSLLLGGSLDGPLDPNWGLELDFSVFNVLHDVDRSHAEGSPILSQTAFHDTGWVTGDAKLRTQHLAGRDDLGLALGYHYERYALATDDSTFNPTATTPAAGFTQTSSGGKTDTHALFAQSRWQFAPRWDVQLGVRYEAWRSIDGFRSTSPQPEQPDRRESALSPKFSLGFAPADGWQIRYSIARATRFPIVEELFRNQSSALSTAISDPTLEPERGLHHNLMFERALAQGYLRANLYSETVRDVIFNQLTITQSGTRVTTFLPIGEEVVHGAELEVGFAGLLGGSVDLSANLSYAAARVLKNPLNPSIEGNRFPRMPLWRGNLLATYHWTSRLDTSAGLRFASDSFGSLDNSDTIDRVFGAQDAYRFVSLRMNYRFGERSRVSFGIDNLFNQKAFVFHPWPMRSFSVEFETNL